MKNLIYLSFTVLFLNLISCSEEAPQTMNEALTKIMEKFDTDKLKTGQDFDLEKTIRIIHGMDMARKETKSSKEFFEYMAKQDYTGVAPEILDMKKKLFPILNQLHNAEKELQDVQLWNNFSNLPEILLTEGGDAIANVAFTGNTMSLAMPAKRVFENIKEKKELEKNIRKEIAKIEDDYVTYLEEFTPLYFKYMKEWDKVCLYRDNAYLELHQGNIEAALLSLNQVLEKSPNDRESLILKSLCLLLKAEKFEKEEVKIENEEYIRPSFATEAKSILDRYLEMYPEQSAPALLLLGTFHWLSGDKDRAISYYDQSSVEYPRQSTQLLDMLNSYKQRTYLRKTAEGSYILQMYKATMEGVGMFSPNFQKAILATKNLNFEEAKEEILRHFFRRGNQQVYDYMISDMQHCEVYLPESFNRIFVEKSFLDLEATNASIWSSNKLNIKIHNRSDVKLSNVRVFLCLQFTDMYKDDYEVFKVETTLNHIDPNSTADFGDIEINFNLYGKEKSVEKDIVRARAIIVTNDIISWVDESNFKINILKDIYKKDIGEQKVISYLENYGMKPDQILSEIGRKSNFNVELANSILSTVGKKDVLKVKIPRKYVFLNPYFSINRLDTREAQFPEELILNGDFMEVTFKVSIKEGENIDFFVSSQSVKLKCRIIIDQNKKIKEVEAVLI